MALRVRPAEYSERKEWKIDAHNPCCCRVFCCVRLPKNIAAEQKRGNFTPANKRYCYTLLPKINSRLHSKPLMCLTHPCCCCCVYVKISTVRNCILRLVSPQMMSSTTTYIDWGSIVIYLNGSNPILQIRKFPTKIRLKIEHNLQRFSLRLIFCHAFLIRVSDCDERSEAYCEQF